MSDYTPTTEQVREAYRKTLRKVDGVYSLVLPEDADAAFDRWLEQVGKTERLAERERIIKLLTEHQWWCDWSDCSCPDTSEAVRIIKGEQQ
jgi:hypothetical protein